MLKTLIADDETPARERLKTLLAAHSEIHIEAECEDGDAVKSQLARNKFDLLLLDIRMPGLSGLDLADMVRSAGQAPAIIFISAYDQHALEAFDLDVLDYLTKPIRPSRLKQAIEKVKSKQTAATGTGKLAIPAREKMEIVNIEDIISVEYGPSGLEIRTLQKPFFVSWTLRQIEDRLKAYDSFIKVSRSALINLNYLKSMEPYMSGTSILLLSDGTKIEASRSATSNLKNLLK